MPKKTARPVGREREPKEFDEEVLEIARVTRVVKGGRRLRFRALVAIGDRKGRVGVGTGKATEVVNAIKKAVQRAKKSLVHVPITSADSIPHQVHVKHKAARVMIMPASSGTGVIAGGSLRKILGLAGVKNVLSKNHGTNNKVVTAQASVKALQKLSQLTDEEKKKVEKAKKSQPQPKMEKREDKRDSKKTAPKKKAVEPKAKAKKEDSEEKKPAESEKKED